VTGRHAKAQRRRYIRNLRRRTAHRKNEDLRRSSFAGPRQHEGEAVSCGGPSRVNRHPCIVGQGAGGSGALSCRTRSRSLRSCSMSCAIKRKLGLPSATICGVRKRKRLCQTQRAGSAGGCHILLLTENTNNQQKNAKNISRKTAAAKSRNRANLLLLSIPIACESFLFLGAASKIRAKVISHENPAHQRPLFSGSFFANVRTVRDEALCFGSRASLL